MTSRTDFSTSSLSEESRYALIAWCSLALLLGIVGNIIILHATIRHSAIKLDALSVTLIKNIAVSDLGLSLFAVHPSLVSLIWKKWPYGTFLCHAFHYLQLPSFLSSNLLICALHISKLTTLLSPLRALARSKRVAHYISAFIWTLAAIPPVIQIIVDIHDVYFDTRIFRCMFSYRAPIWNVILPPISIVLGLLPVVIVTGTTIALLVVVKRARRKTNTQGVFTALFVGCIYLVACTPVVLYTVIHKKIPLPPDVQRIFEIYVFKLAFFSIFINAMFNIFVYYVSVRSFGEYMRTTALHWICRLPHYRKQPFPKRRQSCEMKYKSKARYHLTSVQ